MSLLNGIGFVSSFGGIGVGRWQKTSSQKRVGVFKQAPVRVSVVSMNVMEGAGTEALRPVCPVLMGSAADMERCKAIGKALNELGIDADLRIASAHKVSLVTTIIPLEKAQT